jgi:hypothetical protein
VDERGELALGDVADEAEVGSVGLERMIAVEGAEVSGIPCGAEERGEMAVVAAEHLEYGGELFGEDQEAAVGDVVAYGVDEAVGVEAGVGDAVGEPGLVDLGDEAADVIPACSLAGFAGFADEDDEEIEAVTGGLHHAVGSGAEEVAEGGEELEEDGGGVGFGVGREGVDDLAG